MWWVDTWILFFMIHKTWKDISIMEFNILDVFRTSILQFSYNKNNFYPKKIDICQ